MIKCFNDVPKTQTLRLNEIAKIIEDRKTKFDKKQE